MATVNIRIEEKTKREATKTLSALGLDMSSAVKMFLNQVVIDQGIPFKPSRTPSQIRAEWDKEVAEALKHGKGYTDVSKMFEDILKENE
ncbi:MAG TPA: type II toxin-antitoxin system RelB/DinJ family antitoxin [Candidatus Paceibacterota bacterium]|nr:type II toxin-antitoxin system RelB/DinJ family antitoxin [Candidatus Paceibacterota bacterium]HMO82803.1 type II toxin-antitoxin system RelB/DinJ family antitoxin [Candidatus Paceibacterota bacterium]